MSWKSLGSYLFGDHSPSLNTSSAVNFSSSIGTDGCSSDWTSSSIAGLLVGIVSYQKSMLLNMSSCGEALGTDLGQNRLLLHPRVVKWKGRQELQPNLSVSSSSINFSLSLFAKKGSLNSPNLNVMQLLFTNTLRYKSY